MADILSNGPFAPRRDHYHCPLGCEHPQPFLSLDGQLLCGRCATEGRLTEVVPCTPETCPEDHHDPQVST